MTEATEADIAKIEADHAAHAEDMARTVGWYEFVETVEEQIESFTLQLLQAKDHGDLRELAGKIAALRGVKEYPKTRKFRAQIAAQNAQPESDSLS